MSLPNKGASAIDKKLAATGKAKSLNPDAAAFVPFALRSPRTTGTVDTSSSLGNFGATTPGKAVLDRSESSLSNNSDDEAHQFWRHQLPDDITPDFNNLGEEESKGINGLPFSALTIEDVNETSRFPASTGNGFMLKEHHELSPRQMNGSSIAEKMMYTVPSYGGNPSSATASFQQMPAKPWDMHGDRHLPGFRDGSPYNGNPGQGYPDDILHEQHMEGTEVHPLGFLASQFPGFAGESLADVYFANGGDLNLTIEMLTQLELQVDNGWNQNLNSKALSAPNLSALDFPALSPTDAQNNVPKFSGHDHQMNVNPYRSLEKDNLLMFKSSSIAPSRGAIDFASAVRKMGSQDLGVWKYDRNLSQDSLIGSSRSSHVLASGYSGGHGRGGYGDRLASRSSSRSAPVWLETGEAVANMYSDMRGEARDHARLRNAYFEQARQAYLVGHKALAKELSVKGQLHNMQMKAAHEKAQESIYHQRNPDMQQGSNGQGRERIIDLHGLHVSEAIHVLKRDLTVLRGIARSADQRLQVYVCVGTGHHTRGTRTPARLPVAVQRYLLEEEGLDYSEPQPGLLRVVLY